MSKIILGIDEVGRGCWAGPLVAGAVILSGALKAVADSKALNKAKRERLAAKIYEHAEYAQLGWVWPEEIDKLGLTRATSLAISRAIAEAGKYDILLIDGSINLQAGNSKARSLIRADTIVPAVSAASIIAKEGRDKYMAEQALIYPGYKFEAHVGYGTAAHKKALADFGVTPLHRMSYKPVQRITSIA